MDRLKDDVLRLTSHGGIRQRSEVRRQRSGKVD